MDCVDRKRIDLARQELHRIISNREMKDAVILVFANKQDLRDGKILISACFNFEQHVSKAVNQSPVSYFATHHDASLFCFHCQLAQDLARPRV